jgi:hypothetical protein
MTQDGRVPAARGRAVALRVEPQSKPIVSSLSAAISHAGALRLPVTAKGGAGRLAASFKVPRRSRRQGLRALRCSVLAACGRLRTLTDALRRAADVSGHPARCTEPTMAHDLVSSIESSVLLVRDVAGTYRPAQADEVLHAAQTLLWQQMRGREVLSSPQVVRDFLRVRLGGLEHEVFAVPMLDAQAQDLV